MDLHQYPRPAGDTGIGVHWAAGRSQIDEQTLRSFWIPELQALGVKWVKIADHRQALPLADLLLNADIMPIVRLYRGSSNPGHLGAEQLRALEMYIQIGVRYFEFNHRPDNPDTWQRDHLPENAQSLVAEHLAMDMDAILARGGLPAFPALSPTSGWNLPARLLELGRSDLLEGPVWQAVENEGLNRPPTYPHDPGNREGAPVTQEFYSALVEEIWGRDAWQGRNLETIHRLRQEAMDPAPREALELPDDRLCWRSEEPIHRQLQETLGRTIPILATAGGWSVGTLDDPRYPAITPLLHAAYTLDVCRWIMGTSRRDGPAPPHYFCTGFWLLANHLLGSSRPVDERVAWYSDTWPEMALPIVHALKAEPKRCRLPQPAPQVNHSDRDAAPWMVRSPQPSSRGGDPGGAVIRGQVRGGAGAQLWLVHQSGQLYRTVARPDGGYRFVDLPAGSYTLWVASPAGSRQEGIQLDDQSQKEIPLTVDGWGHEARILDEDQGPILRCRVASSAVTSESGTLAIRLRRVDDSTGQSNRVVSMARRADGASGCEIGPLATGIYRVEILGVVTAGGDPHPLEAVVELVGPTHLSFVYNRPFEALPRHFSQITGRVTHGLGTQIVLTDETGRSREIDVDEEGIYLFEYLPPGCYDLHVAGWETLATRNRLGLDGRNELEVDFYLPEATPDRPEPEPAWGTVEGRISRLRNQALTLIAESGRHYATTTDEEGRFQFYPLEPGTYVLGGPDLWVPGLEVEPYQRLWVEFPLSSDIWQYQILEETDVHNAGIVRVQVMGRRSSQIRLTGAEVDMQAVTGTADASSPFSAQFGPLQPDTYTVIPQSLDIQAPIHLQPNTMVTVVFRRGGLVTGPPRLHYFT